MKNEILEGLGNRIKRIRKKLRISQADFAKMLGVSGASAVSKYELEQREPDISTLVKISQLGNRSLNWLLVNRPPPKEKKVDKKLGKIISQTERIFREGNPKKLSALRYILNSMDPDASRDRKDKPKR